MLTLKYSIRKEKLKLLKAVKLRIYPNQTQREQIDITINHCRYVWNTMLDMQIKRYESNKNAKFINTFGMNILLTTLKQEQKWLKEADATSLQETNAQLNDSFKSFFKKLSGFPNFKSRKSTRKSYTSKMNMAIVDDKHIKIAKLGTIHFRNKVLPTGKLKRVTISISATGKYYAMALFETSVEPFSKTNSFVGLDFGLTHLAIQSNDYKLPNIRFDKELAKKKNYWEKKLARRRLRALSIIHEQKKLGRYLDLPDFSNYMKAKYNVAKINEKIANQRNDYLQKYTTKLVKAYDIIAIEDLKSSNMLKNHKLARAIANASWRKLRTMLEYKSKWYGKRLLVVDPRYTTQVDNETGEIKKHPLSVRTYVNSLGHVVDRDINASKNILQWAIYPETRITKA